MKLKNLGLCAIVMGAGLASKFCVSDPSSETVTSQIKTGVQIVDTNYTSSERYFSEIRSKLKSSTYNSPSLLPSEQELQEAADFDQLTSKAEIDENEFQSLGEILAPLSEIEISRLIDIYEKRKQLGRAASLAEYGLKDQFYAYDIYSRGLEDLQRKCNVTLDLKLVGDNECIRDNLTSIRTYSEQICARSFDILRQLKAEGQSYTDTLNQTTFACKNIGAGSTADILASIY